MYEATKKTGIRYVYHIATQVTRNPKIYVYDTKVLVGHAYDKEREREREREGGRERWHAT